MIFYLSGAEEVRSLNHERAIAGKCIMLSYFNVKDGQKRMRFDAMLLKRRGTSSATQRDRQANSFDQKG
jgi:hypothetical protein